MKLNITTNKKLLTPPQLSYAAKVNPDGLIRLARFLNLPFKGLQLRQVARIIRWHITKDELNNT